MAYAKLVAFDRPLAGAALPGHHGRVCSDAELARSEQAAYQRGVDAARSLADQELVDLRASIDELSSRLFQSLGSVEGALLAQLRTALPGLAVEIARRLLAGYEPPAEAVARLCEEALREILPERENLELSVSARDAALLEKLQPDWMARYPGLRIRVDAALGAGECQVRSRFGLTDARLQAKLNALHRCLQPA